MSDKIRLSFAESYRRLDKGIESVVINGTTGIWGKVNKFKLDLISDFVHERLTKSELVAKMPSKEERDEIFEILNVMIDEKMILMEEMKREKKYDEVEFRLTNRCNLSCIHCIAKSGPEEQEYLSTEEMKVIVDRCYELGAKSLLVTGGEPLVRDDIYEILQHARGKGDWEITLMTNGVLIDEESAKKLFQSCDEVSISTDGYDAKTTDFIRGSGVFEKVMDAVSHLKKAGFKNENLSLTMVATENNGGNEQKFNELLGNLGIQGGIRGLSLGGRAFDNKEDLMLGSFLNEYDLSKSKEELREELKCRLVCSAGEKKICVNEKGDVYPCLLLLENSYKVCNILNDNCKEVLFEEEYDNFLKKNIRDSYVDKIDGCKECEVRYFCMNDCLGNTKENLGNGILRKERCEVIKPFLIDLIWND